MTTICFDESLQQIAQQVREIVLDTTLRPKFAPAAMAEAVLAYPLAGGKALRPALLTWACAALGGDERAALRAGVAVELYHTYTLVHDDIIDRDPVRRGKPSVHVLATRSGEAEFDLGPEDAAHYGLSLAILAADIQQAWSIYLLSSLPELGVDPLLTLQLIRRLEGITGPAILEGETVDIQLPFLPVEQVTPEMILHVIRTKTAALFAYCAWTGGMLARGADDADVQALSAFAECAGIAFQLQDDVLGLVGDEAKLGKPVGSDLREGKRTLIIALAWQRASEAERAQLAAVLGNPTATPTAAAETTALLQRLGAIDDVQTMATRHLDDAITHLNRLPDTPHRALLHEMALRMLQREK